jgi:electron transfer flavoprotein beta subunit
MPLKIAVCFKVVPEFEQVVEADWDNFNLATDLSYVKRVFGCFDESALEIALRLRSAWKSFGESVECTALTASPLPSPLCKTLFAAGFDRVLDLSGAMQGEESQRGTSPEHCSGEFRPLYTAAVLGTYLEPSGYDLILAGRQAGYADTGIVPLALAEALGLPVITQVEEIAPCNGGVEIRRVSDTGQELLRVRLPLLAIVGNSPVAALRAVTLSARMAVSKRSAERPELPASARTAPQLAANTGPAGFLRFSREAPRKNCRFLPAGANLAQSVAEIASEYINGWNKNGRGRDEGSGR